MLELIYVPCIYSRKGKYNFPCVNALCPFGKSPQECLNFLDNEEKELFEELIDLRVKVLHS